MSNCVCTYNSDVKVKYFYFFESKILAIVTETLGQILNNNGKLYILIIELSKTSNEECILKYKCQMDVYR